MRTIWVRYTRRGGGGPGTNNSAHENKLSTYEPFRENGSPIHYVGQFESIQKHSTKSDQTNFHVLLTVYFVSQTHRSGFHLVRVSPT